MNEMMDPLGDKLAGEMAYAEESRTPGTCFSDGLLLPEMVIVPAGKFWMGADDDGDKLASSMEKPRHWVEIARPLAVSRYPITFEQWDAYADGNPDVYRPDDRGLGRGRRPVANVSWEDAQEYLTWLSMSAARPYRLLSEAEWEYCCRAGEPVSVGSYRPNGFGLFDMHGNVCELVADSWHDNYRGAPTDGSAWGQMDAAMWRVVRCPFRDRVHHTKRMDNVGFRVACDLR